MLLLLLLKHNNLVKGYTLIPDSTSVTPLPLPLERTKLSSAHKTELSRGDGKTECFQHNVVKMQTLSI